MSGIDVTVPQQPLLPVSVSDVPSERRLEGDEFARSLRQLESPQPAPDIEPSTVPSRADALDQWSGVTDEIRLDTDEPAVSALSPNDERLMRQDGAQSDSDVVLEVSALHCQSAPGIATVEPLPGGSAVMTLHDFASLLERPGGTVVSDGEQAWRFTLQDPALMISQVALTKEAALGHWSVALTVPGGSQPVLSPHLQRLRERLEALGQGVTHVIVTREETS